MMKNKAYIPHHLINNRWGRLGFALALTFILLLIPVTVGTVIRIPVPTLTQPTSIAEMPTLFSKRAIELSLPFGPSLVRAAGGLTVTKVAASTVDLGGVLTYTLTVTNGTGVDLTPADTVVVFDYLPSGAVDCLPTTSPSGWSIGCVPGTDPTFWTLDSGSFPQGDAVIFTYTISISSSLSNQAEIVNDNYGGFVGIDPPTQGPPVTTTVDAPVWAITKTVSSDTIQPGQTLVYTITATNIGAFATSGAYTITDAVPDNTTLVDASADELPGPSPPWSFSDSLDPAGLGKRVVTYSVQVTSPLTGGIKIVNDGYTVFGGSVASGATNDSITTTVDSPVTLSITKTASSDPIKVGKVLTYTLTITNNAATGPAENVMITDTLSNFVNYLSAGFVGGTSGTIITGTGGNPVVWTLAGPIPANGSAQVTVTVQVSDTLPNPPEITNQFQASASNAPQVSDSMDVVVEPGVVNSVTLDLDPTTISNLCGTTVATATVLDGFNNPISDTSVAIAEFGGNTHVQPVTSGSGFTNASGVFSATFRGIIANPTVSMVASSGGKFGGETLTIFTGTPIPATLDLSVSPNPLAPGGATAVVQGIVRDCNNDLISGQDVNFTLSDIGLASFPGPSATITTTTVTGVATATLTSASSAGTLTITGTVGSVQEVTTLSIQSPVLTITKTANPNSGNTVQPGSTVIYDLVLSNNGTAAATGIVITDELHSGVGFVTASLIGATGNVFNNSGVITFSVTSSLGIGLTMTARIEVTVTAALSGTIITNTAEASDQTGPTGSSNMVSHQVITTTSTNNDVYLPLVIKG